MKLFLILLGRELSKRFTSRSMLAGMIMFSALSAALSFFIGNFFESNQASLSSFFAFHPWLYLFIVPLLSSGAFEMDREFSETTFILTLPISIFKLVSARFLSTWFVVATMLMFTLSMVWTVNYLGSPDNGVIASSYFGSWLLAGVFLAVGGCASAMTNKKSIAYLLTTVACFFLWVCGLPIISVHLLNLIDAGVVERLYDISLLNFYERVSGGVLSVQGLLSVIGLIGALLAAAVSILNFKARA